MKINLLKGFKKTKADLPPETIDGIPEEVEKKKRKGFFGFGSRKKRGESGNAVPAGKSVEETLNDGSAIHTVEKNETNSEIILNEPDTAVRKSRPISPITIVLIILIIVGGVGTYMFMQFRDSMNLKLRKQAKGSVFRTNPGEGMGGINFGGDKPPAATTDTGIPSNQNASSAASGVANGNPAAPAGPTKSSQQTALSAKEGEKTVVASVTPGKIEQKGTGGTLSATTASTSPSNPATSQVPPPSVQNDRAPAVTAPVPVNEKLPVPIKLALKDDAPFKSRFEKKYADRLAAKNPKGAKPPGSPAQGTKVDIKDLIGADGKPMAPGLAPGALDVNALVAGGVPAEKISLYGVMVSGGRKVAITSRGEVQIGGMLYGEKIVDITPDGVKLKSGRMLQVASE